MEPAAKKCKREDTIVLTNIVEGFENKNTRNNINHHSQSRIQLIKDENISKELDFFFTIPKTYENVTNYDKMNLYVTGYLPTLKIITQEDAKIYITVDLLPYRLKHELNLLDTKQLNIDAYIPKLGSCNCDSYSLSSESETESY